MWKITPLNLGRQQVKKSVQIEDGPDTLIWIPFVAWLLENEATDDIYLVDCGPDSDDAQHVRCHNPLAREEDQYILAQLEKHGVAPEQLTALIATHLHWDHLQAISELPSDLPIYVQREEFAYAGTRRGMTGNAPYETDLAEQGLPYFLRCYHQYRFLDGAATIAEGISVVPVPGHTPGCQAVLVDTAQGTRALVGDLVNLQENWAAQRIPGLNYDRDACLASYQLMRSFEQQGVTIVPSHDFQVFDWYEEK